jgi:hypothetical protein
MALLVLVLLTAQVTGRFPRITTQVNCSAMKNIRIAVAALHGHAWRVLSEGVSA